MRQVCEHVRGDDDLMYVRPERREGDNTYECPCCGAVAYAATPDQLGDCPYCGVAAVEVDGE